jgi:hypothetical protein
MGPEEPRQPGDGGAERPSDDDDTFGYNDPAFDDRSQRPRRAGYSDGPGYSPDAGYSPSAGYGTDEYRDEYEAPVFTEEELSGLDGNSGPRRVLPLEDEPTTLVSRYLFPTERYRGEWKRHWIHLSSPLGIGAGATLLLGYLAGFLTRQNINGLVTAAVLIWLAVIGVAGIITRRVAMMPLLRVTDMKYEQSALGRMLNYGTFVLESAGQDQALREVKHLPNPNELYLRVVEEMYEPQAVEARLGKDGDAGDDA